jgi:hypothetical protein
VGFEIFLTTSTSTLKMMCSFSNESPIGAVAIRCILLGAAFGAALQVSALASDEISEQDLTFFESEVRPLLIERCYECHSAESGKRKGGLLLDHRMGWFVGGDTGPAIVPGSVSESLVSRAISYEDPDFEMPPKGRLPQSEIEIINQWIQRGAPDPRQEIIEFTGSSKPKTGIDWDKEREFWAFQPMSRSEIPEVRRSEWVWTELDAFILHELEARDLEIAPDADEQSLARRMSFDLVGCLRVRIGYEFWTGLVLAGSGMLIYCWHRHVLERNGEGVGWISLGLRNRPVEVGVLPCPMPGGTGIMWWMLSTATNHLRSLSQSRLPGIYFNINPARSVRSI